MTAPSSVLVVEDDVDIREAVVELLSDEGYAAVGAENGERALALLRDGSSLPFLILLDMMMPIMDGAAFRAEQLRDPVLCGIPIVIMSASAHIEAAANELGASAHLKKPIHLFDLLSLAARFSAPPGGSLPRRAPQ